MGQIQSYYRILGLEATADAKEIQTAIKKMRDIDTDGNYTAILNKIEKTLLPQGKKKAHPPAAQTAAPPRPAAAPVAPVATPRPAAKAAKADSADDDLDFGFDLPSPPPRRAAPAPEKTHRSAFAADMTEELPLQEEDTAHPEGFLDFGESEYLSEPQKKRNQPLQDHRVFITPEEIEAYNKPPSLLSRIFSGRNLILASLLLALLVAAAISALPLYNIYLANKQSDAAYASLVTARKDVDNFIRQNKYFPDQLPGSYDSEFYSLRLNTQNESIEANFSHSAADNLQGHSLIMSTYIKPNIGLQWKCDTSASYPQKFRPAQCF